MRWLPSVSLTLILAVLATHPLPVAATDATYWKHDPASIGDWADLANWTNGLPADTAIGVDGFINNSGTASLATGTYLTRGIYVGAGGNGSVVQTGGALVATTLQVGNGLGATGTYTLSGSGTLSSTVEFIGYNQGYGQFVQNGGAHIVDSGIQLGRAGTGSSRIIHRPERFS